MLRAGATLLLAALSAAVLQCAGPASGKLDMVPVAVAHGPLNVARYEVTVAEWKACSDAGACDAIAPQVPAPAVTPMTGVNWFDVAAYIDWYNASHGRHLRLPTADEWRDFSGKPEPVPAAPLFTDPRLAWAANYGQEESPRGPVRPQGSWPRTKTGLQDIEGNVWEWTSTCITPVGSEADASHCPAMTAMGAHRAVMPVFVRDPASGGCATGRPPTHIGFRLVEDVGQPQV